MYRIKNALLVAVVCTCALAKEMSPELEVLTSQRTRCTYERAFDMYGANCAGLGLAKIPNLHGNIEILQFSDNKLRELRSDTLSRYSSVKFLYLAENKIYSIDENALSYLSSLETLDLSNNVIQSVPASIFQMPSLRNLYLSGNPLTDKSFDLIIGNHIGAPLEVLDISDCKITKLPEWGILPQITLYNISTNQLVAIEPKHFALMCNLKKIDMTASIDKVPLCKLKSTVQLFQEKNVNFHLKDYERLNSKEFENCYTNEVSEILNATQLVCKQAYVQVQTAKGSRRTWLTICGGLAGFLVGFILLLYILHIAQTKSVAQKIKHAKTAHDKDKPASVALINNSA